jgi:hypothetical protein
MRKSTETPFSAVVNTCFDARCVQPLTSSKISNNQTTLHDISASAKWANKADIGAVVRRSLTATKDGGAA